MTKLALLGVLALLAAAPASAEKENKINLRLKAETLDEGENTIYTFESKGRLIARASAKGIAGYDLDTFTRMRLPLKKSGTKEEVLDAPVGSIDSDCIEWRERCYKHKAVKIRVCDTVCTKIYDKATKTVLPVTEPETIYVAITSNVVDFRDSALKSDNPVYMKPRSPDE
jgi:hypothetical protein